MKPTYIVAGTRAEFERYVQEKYEYWSKMAMLMPEYRYVRSVDDLRGMQNIKGFYVGTWSKRPDINLIKSFIEAQKRL
jgi:hypothetical protein